jgi:methylphosphotriester-DNA--protein-cysteine methyltransferase
MSDYLNVDQVISMLEAKRAGRTLEEFSDEVGVSYQYLGHLFRRVRTPGKEILRYLGLKKIVFYVKNGKRS